MTHERFMRRAFELARLGEGRTSPNPMVGAVLVYENRIIGEGYHAVAGGPHAEVQAIRAVSAADQSLIPHSTLYVSLEPCCIHGRTPPCVDLIIAQQIPRVVISSLDQTPGIQGHGVALLRKHGVDVTEGVLQQEGDWLAARRNLFVQQHRPFVLLKYAMSMDGFMGKATHQVVLSNDISWRLVHRLRHSMDAIMVGTDTVISDDPQLTNRLFWGKHPIRVIPDLQGRISPDSRLFQAPGRTYLFRSGLLPLPTDLPEGVTVMGLDPQQEPLPQILARLADAGITGLLVEGGGRLLRSFLVAGLWDEAIVSSCNCFLGEGVPNPSFLISPEDKHQLGDNTFFWFRHPRYGSSPCC